MSFQDFEAGLPLTALRVLVDGGNRQQDTSQAVAAGVFKISTSVRNFEGLVKAIGTPKDTPEFRDKLRNVRQQIGRQVKDASAKLKQACETDHCAEVSENKKIADVKLAKDFQTILKEFQNLQRLAVERETAFAPLVQQLTSRQKVLLLDNDVVFNEAIIKEREQGIQEIQQQIGEVNEIFKDLAVLVHDQGNMIDGIDSHVESSYASTAQAKTEISKAAKMQKSTSCLACLLMVIFAIALLIVITVLAA